MLGSIILTSTTITAAAIGKPFSMKFTAKNNTEAKLPKNTRLWYHGDAMVMENSVPFGSLAPHAEKSMTINLECYSDVTWRVIPRAYSVSLRSGDTVHVTQEFDRRMGEFVSYLREVKPSPKHDSQFINILTCGFMGSGKSSFINTCITMMSGGNDIIHKVKVGGDSDHNTDAYSGLVIDGTKLRLFDSWGMDGRNYRAGELEMIVDGLMPTSGVTMDDNMRQLYSEVIKHQSTRGARLPHAILFFVAFALLDDAQQMESLSEQLKKIKSRGHNPLVVVARLDEAVPRLRQSPCETFPEVEQYRLKASRALGVPLNLVRYSVPYTVETERRFEIERLCYGILYDVLNLATTFSESVVPAAAVGAKKYDWD